MWWLTHVSQLTGRVVTQFGRRWQSREDISAEKQQQQGEEIRRGGALQKGGDICWGAAAGGRYQLGCISALRKEISTGEQQQKRRVDILAGQKQQLGSSSRSR